VFAKEPWANTEVPLKKVRKNKKFSDKRSRQDFSPELGILQAAVLFSRSASWQQKQISGERNNYAKKRDFEQTEMMRTANRKRVC
jgi:hypothetical protein